MNKKGFTLVEILAVIVILAVLAGIATMSVTRYQALVREKEAVHLHSEIESNYSNLILNDKANDSGKVRFCSRGYIIMSISYDGKRLGCRNDNNADIRLNNGSYLISKNKGDLLNNSAYREAAQARTEVKDEDGQVVKRKTLEEIFVEDGVCMVEVDEARQKLNQDGTETKSDLKQTCIKDNNENFIKSTNSVLCIKLIRPDGSAIINDFDTSNEKNTSFCKYFGE